MCLESEAPSKPNAVNFPHNPMTKSLNHNERLEALCLKEEIMNRLIDLLRVSLARMLTSTGTAGILAISFAAPFPALGAATSHLPAPRPGSATSGTVPSLQLPALSNATINVLPSGRTEIRFPSGSGFMTPGRHEFRDQTDLIDYLAQTFPVVRDDRGGVRISLKRVSNYRRIDLRGQQIFTFGDPILDLITDQDGQLIVAGKVYDMRTAELSDRSQIGSGAVLEPGAPAAPQLSNAVYRRGESSYHPVRTASPAASLQSNPPTSVTFSVPGGTIRVRAFRRNYGVGWKAGADIQTWGGDFTRATVDSQYGQNIFGNFCGVVKRDSDTDTNDDYVDEYEWGIASSMPSGVRSTGTILWKGLTYSRVVQNGCSGGWL